MSTLDKAIETQLKNIQTKTGKSLDELAKIIKASGLAKHGEIRDMLKTKLGLGHGDANTLVHVVLKSDGATAAKESGASIESLTDEIYSGAKATLRPIHDAFMKKVSGFGEFEIAPKKGYMSLRRKKQFCMIGPATNSRVEVGINAKGLAETERLQIVPSGGMCNYKVKLTSEKEVDKELIGWIKTAFDSAG